MHNFVLFGAGRDQSLFAQWEKEEKQLFSPKKCNNVIIQRPESGFTEISEKPVVLF